MHTKTLHNMLVFHGEELLAPSPNPKLKDYHLLKYTWLLIRYIHGYLSIVTTL